MNTFEQQVSDALESTGSEYALCKRDDLTFYCDILLKKLEGDKQLHMSTKRLEIAEWRIKTLSFQNKILKFEIEYMKIKKTF
jgi:hypothetical protein